ncbi:MAG: CotH kinase family protein [Clostridia bacterium]|nr:CotH kinase family protein [Clostridia bacterium]
MTLMTLVACGPKNGISSSPFPDPSDIVDIAGEELSASEEPTFSEAPSAPAEVQTPAETTAPTEAPTPTAVPTPAETPTPTEVPTPTETPRSTEVPTPTEAPAPTGTPSPTGTPVPAKTPTPTAVPSTPDPTKEPEPGTREYYEKNAYICTVKTDSRIVPSLYTEGKELPDGLSDIFYTSDSPGGEPTRENGNLWLCLKPKKGYLISSVNVEGSYAQIEDLGRDIYIIRGVNSNIKVTASSGAMANASNGKTLLGSYGYGISDSGRLIVTWTEAEEEPLRYVEVTVTGGAGTISKTYDGEIGECDIMKLTKNDVFTVKLKCYGYEQIGSSVSFSACYVPDARSVDFPRVEITTEDYVWPTCEYVTPPPGNIGAGITNATWENSIVKIYDASDNVVYDSSQNCSEEEQYQGAKMKIRGNTSAYGIKKPYKIKLKKKSDLLAPFIDRPSDGKSYADKEWLLLNYGTDIYRVAGDAIADVVGTPWSPDYTYVSLYVNGDYRGIYILSECVKQGTGKGDARWRCPVEDDGFVIEFDAYWWNEPLYFTTPSSVNFVMKYTFKYPDTDDIDAKSDAYKYIKNYMTELERALSRNDSSYLDYIDLDSFVSWVLVADYMCLLDSGGNNLFMWKKDSTENSKLVMGPNWDFDSWKWNIDSFANIHRDGSHFYFPQLSRKPEFAKAYAELFRNTYDKVTAAVNADLDKINEAAYNKLYQLESTRYQSGSYRTLSAMRNDFNTWMAAHLTWMQSQIG